MSEPRVIFTTKDGKELSQDEAIKLINEILRSKRTGKKSA